MKTMAYKLDSLCEITSSKRIFYSEYTESGIPFFRSKEVIDLFNKNNIATELFISEDRYNEIKTKFGVPEKDDMLLTSVGTIGIPYLVKSSDKFYFKDGNLTWFRKYNHNLIEPLYLYYWVISSVGKQTLTLLSMGAAQPALTISRLKNLNLNLPTTSVQQKIASILSTYDTLIENNNRRIRLLEQIAENLYKEWFAYHKIKEQSKAVKLKEIISITRGLSYSSEEISCVDGNNLINLKNIQGYGGFRLDGTKKYNGKYKPEQIVKEGNLIMGVTDMTQDRRTVGSVALIPNVNVLSIISADLIKINSNIENTYLYAMFRYGNVSRYIAQFANGANVLHLRPKSILNIKVILPNQHLIDSFVLKVKPMIHLINRLNTEIDLLTRQRDLLLPRLMSGKLEVKP